MLYYSILFTQEEMFLHLSNQYHFWPRSGEVCCVIAHLVFFSSLATLLNGMMLHEEAAHITVVICKIP